MKAFFLLIALTAITPDTHAQVELRKRGFYLGAFASPDYSYRKVGQQFPGPALDGSEIPKLAYTCGLDALYQFNEQLSLSFGAQLSEKGERTKYLEFTFSSPEPDAPLGIWTDYKDIFIDLPLRVNYYTSIRKRCFFLTGGISTNIFLYENYVKHLNYDGGRLERRSDKRQAGFHRINPQLQLGFGMDLAFKSSRLKVFPIFRCSLLRASEIPMEGNFYSIGLGTSYVFKL